MDNKLYKMMNWPEIESIIYSECDQPHDMLGKHNVNGGTLIQCFFPGAVSVLIKGDELKSDILMSLVDEEGFFAYWTSDRIFPDYLYEVCYKDGSIEQFPESYNYLPKLDKSNTDKFYAGLLYDMYNILGVHECEHNGVKGFSFMVYAPLALRVSVVGSFNNWDGRISQMTRLDETGIFSVFIPSAKEGDVYKYEIKLKNGLTYLKRDPFSVLIERNALRASIVSKDAFFEWDDNNKYKSDFCLNDYSKPLSFGEIWLRHFLTKSTSVSDALDEIIKFIKDYDYDAVIFDNLTKEDNKICSYSLFSINGFDREDIMYLVNGLHKENIPVIFTLDLSSMSNDNEGLKGFDGRKLYEAIDDREIDHTITFDFSKKYVRNYLISAVFYYLKTFRFDGFVLRNTDRILYHNYSRAENDYTVNIYGKPENLGGEELLKHLNSVLHKKDDKIITIAGDSLNSFNLTKSLDEDGFGFDYKFDNHLHASMRLYFKHSPAERKLHYNELTNVLINAFCERFIVLLPLGDYGNTEELLVNEFNGNIEDKYKNFKLMLAALFTVPGLKCLPFTSFENEMLNDYINKLDNIYKTHPAFNTKVNDKDCFEWLDTTDPDRSSVTFLRKGTDNEIMVSFNFSDQPKTVELNFSHKTSFIEIFNSNDFIYGGDHNVKDTPLVSRSDKANKDKNIVKFTLNPLSVSMFQKI